MNTKVKIKQMQRGSINKKLPTNFSIDKEIRDVDTSKTLTKMTNILCYGKQIDKLHSSVEDMKIEISRVISRANKHIDDLNNSIVLCVTTNVASHTETVNKNHRLVCDDMCDIGLIVSKLSNLDIAKLSKNYSTASSDIDWLQQNTTEFVGKALSQLKFSKEDKQKMRDGCYTEYYADSLEDLRGDCDQFTSEIQDICDELIEECVDTYDRCVLSNNIYFENIGLIRKQQLEYLINNHIAHKSVCDAYHKKSSVIIDEQLKEYLNNDSKPVSNITNFITDYKDAYTKLQKDTKKSLAICNQMKTDIKKDNILLQEHRLSSLDEAITKNQILAINETMRNLDESTTKVGRQYKISTADLRTRKEALEESFQKFA